MMGSKFFEPGNTSIYVQGIDESGNSLWLRNHVAYGFTSLQTFWKSFIATPATNPTRYFAVASGKHVRSK
jgi:hypothetical protein